MPSLPDSRIVFDLDDTLYLERDFAFSGYEAVERWLGAPGFAALCRGLFQRGQRSNIFDRALAEAGIRDRRVPDLVAVYRDHTPRIELCPDARRYLDRHGRRFALITDGPERTQRAKIEALRLGRWFDRIVPTGQWIAGYGKPHPRAFEMIATDAGGPCVYIADNAAKDFLAPNTLGWLTVQILRPDRVHDGAPPTPDHAAQIVIDSLDQLDDILG